MGLPDDLLGHQLAVPDADELEDRALRVHTLQQATAELGEDFERSVSEIKERLLTLGVPEVIIDEIVVQQIIGDSVGNAAIAYSAQKLRTTLDYKAAQLDAQMVSIHEGMKGLRHCSYTMPLTLPRGEVGEAGVTVYTTSGSNSFEKFNVKGDKEYREADKTDVQLFPSKDGFVKTQGMFFGVEITDVYTRDVEKARLFPGWKKDEREVKKETRVVYKISPWNIREFANGSFDNNGGGEMEYHSSHQFLREINQSLLFSHNERVKKLTTDLVDVFRNVPRNVAEYLRSQHESLDGIIF